MSARASSCALRCPWFVQTVWLARSSFCSTLRSSECPAAFACNCWSGVSSSVRKLDSIDCVCLTATTVVWPLAASLTLASLTAFSVSSTTFVVSQIMASSAPTFVLGVHVSYGRDLCLEASRDSDHGVQPSWISPTIQDCNDPWLMSVISCMLRGGGLGLRA